MKTALIAAVCVGVVGIAPAWAQQGETVRIAVIEGFSGAFAATGDNQLNTWHYVIDHMTPEENPAGVRFEVVPMDSKGSPQDAIRLMQAAADQGFHYIAQGNGSNVAVPLAQAVDKNNARNPGKELLFLNYAAVDPVLTGEECSYWHFRFEPDTSMKMAALTRFMRDQPQITRVYLNNQNYSHGQQVARYFKEGIARNRPDVEVVGEDYVGLGQVKDFAPYVAKIKASGADALVTGSWGPDFTLLAKAMAELGVNIPIYAYYAYATGTPTALSQIPGGATVYSIAPVHSNYDGHIRELMDGLQNDKQDELVTFGIYSALVGLGNAIASAGSTDPLQVAAAFEDLHFKDQNGEDVVMRSDDHQMQSGLWLAKWQPVDDAYSYDLEGTGYTFAPIQYLSPAESSTPTSCQMKRPG